MVQGDVCVLVSPHSLHRCGCQSQCGAHPVPCSANICHCAWCRICVAVQGVLLNADSVRDTIYVVTLSVLPVFVLRSGLVRDLLLRLSC